MLHSLDSNKDVDVAKFGKTSKDRVRTVLP